MVMIILGRLCGGGDCDWLFRLFRVFETVWISHFLGAPIMTKMNLEIYFVLEILGMKWFGSGGTYKIEYHVCFNRSVSTFSLGIPVVRTKDKRVQTSLVYAQLAVQVDQFFRSTLSRSLKNGMFIRLSHCLIFKHHRLFTRKVGDQEIVQKNKTKKREFKLSRLGSIMVLALLSLVVGSKDSISIEKIWWFQPLLSPVPTSWSNPNKTKIPQFASLRNFTICQ